MKNIFFNEKHHTSCSVVLTKSYNKVIEHYSIVDDKQTKDNKKENTESPLNSVGNDITNETISFTFSTYRYTKEELDNFFDSDNGQIEEHTLEESICRELIAQQNTKPFFYYCKEDPKVENIHLKSIEDHIRLKDPEHHKAKLLEISQKERRETILR